MKLKYKYYIWLYTDRKKGIKLSKILKKLVREAAETTQEKQG